MNLEASNENLYNNADSFSMAFDAAWNDCDLGNDKDKKIEEKIQIAFEKIKTHPFIIENPIQAKDIAHFRIKLLGLA
tara:strand:+ start:170 stop:400 length:231 start_codon:yes stop_codon:yes gene_type:complete